MRWFVTILLIALLVSVALNFVMWSRLHSQNTIDASTTLSEFVSNEISSSARSYSKLHEQQPDKSSQSQRSLSTTKPDYDSPSTSQEQRDIYRIKQQIAAGELDAAQLAIQDRLRADPQNIEFLLLEAQWVKATANINTVLSHYYGLLDLALNTEQRAAVLLTINTLTAENIEKLKSIKAWDVLATFLEPLWHFDPNRRSIILGLAEAYAMQRQEFLMENVLASLPQGDMEATRVRQVFHRQTIPTEQPAADQVVDNSSAYERSIALTSLGNHYIAPLQVNRFPINLMIDTGASTTVITLQKFRNISTHIAAKYIGTYQVNTAGGKVDAPIYQLQHIFLGGFRLDNIAVVVLDMPEFAFADGLLGMNILNQFDFKIDQQTAQLHLNRMQKN